MFDLEKAISAWRKSLELNRTFLPEDIDELERHVRDQVDALTRKGIPEDEAYARAIEGIGRFDAVEAEYRKVFWTKLRRLNRLGAELRHALTLFGSYLKINYRNAVRHKGYSALNIFGLALGMACCLLILIYVQDEVSFDRFHDDAANTYRVNWDFRWNNAEGVGPGTPPPLARTFAEEMPEVTSVTRLYPISRMVTRHDEVFFSESGIVAADTNFFQFFDFPLREGDPESALSNPNSVVLTEGAAQRYFGDASPLGEVLTLGEDYVFLGRAYSATFTVTGVVADPPHNSHIRFDMLTSMASHPEPGFFDWSWVWMQVTTYAKLRPGADAAAIEARVPDIVMRRGADAFRRLGIDYNSLREVGERFTFVFQPLTDVYLGAPETGNRLGPVGDRSYVLIAGTVALFVLLIACINFMNLATARSSTRSREVGVRKVLGSQRRMLVGQFLAESLVFSAMAVPLALVMVWVSIGPFNQLTGKSLELNLLRPSWLPLVVLLLPVIVGLFAGSYPGIYLSSFRPIHVLKGTFRAGRGSRRFRNSLVVFQFAMTIGLIACTLLVQRQLDFMRRADLGFEREGIILIDNENDRLSGQGEVFKERLKSHPEILSASISSGVPPGASFEDSYRADGQSDVAITSYLTDEDFTTTLGIEIIDGRGFSRDRVAEAESVLLNEAAVRALGLTDPVGKQIVYPGGNGAVFQVIGVMKDFNFLTLRSPVTPFALFHQSSKSYQTSGSEVVVRLAREDLQSAIRILESEWNAIAPAMPFEYSFLDENFDEQYLNDRRLGRIFGVFSALAVSIACLGLLGLAAFAAEQRTKEIGIRKVLGADVSGIVALLSKDFIKLIAVAFFLAVPVAYLLMQRWLEDFVYRVEMGPSPFILTGVLVLALALATVAYHALRAALADPVRSLRYE